MVHGLVPVRCHAVSVSLCYKFPLECVQNSREVPRGPGGACMPTVKAGSVLQPVGCPCEHSLPSGGESLGLDGPSCWGQTGHPQAMSWDACGLGEGTAGLALWGQWVPQVCDGMCPSCGGATLVPVLDAPGSWGGSGQGPRLVGWLRPCGGAGMGLGFPWGRQQWYGAGGSLCVGLEPPRGSPAPALPPGKRTKKGMATAKQRLGKILKIHRNGKLLL